MTNKKPIRLPPLRVLRVRNPNRPEPNRCLTVMSSVLACWASAGYHGRGCTTVEQALRACMDAPAPPKKSPNTVNYHLARFAKRLISQASKNK
ncbi:d47c3383-1fea-4729-9607-21341bc0474b [Thermothielavioides terrestris]|uniref:Small ribosomal subunit protein mS37 n=2 Tax=Thermothielavioides terrestris TaxID=2587410 RepID=G2R672_THETT|nr:mitochondrial 37S ribosomal protein YmS-T [Thermothielavioides terrestris NRRL 8126]AEO68405.1 hypothetical protein THITE_2067623 [Thermothielavioides terrestris NRRL 8126]SPQ24325.1 d47c3383-1fea-4729-9607-21341bc0474b [Thermothielavioides terrestris]